MLHGKVSLILISITKKRGLLAMVLAAGLLGGAGWLLTRRVLPTMLVEGNRVIMARAAAALEELGPPPVDQIAVRERVLNNSRTLPRQGCWARRFLAEAEIFL